MISKRNAVIGFLVLLAVIMLMPMTGQANPAPAGKVFYMTLPAPTSPVGPLRRPTALPTHAPTRTPTAKLCVVYQGQWIGPCK